MNFNSIRFRLMTRTLFKGTIYEGLFDFSSSIEGVSKPRCEGLVFRLAQGGNRHISVEKRYADGTIAYSPVATLSRRNNPLFVDLLTGMLVPVDETRKMDEFIQMLCEMEFSFPLDSSYDDFILKLEYFEKTLTNL